MAATADAAAAHRAAAALTSHLADSQAARDVEERAAAAAEAAALAADVLRLVRPPDVHCACLPARRTHVLLRHACCCVGLTGLTFANHHPPSSFVAGVFYRPRRLQEETVVQLRSELADAAASEAAARGALACSGGFIADNAGAMDAVIADAAALRADVRSLVRTCARAAC